MPHDLQEVDMFSEKFELSEVICGRSMISVIANKKEPAIIKSPLKAIETAEHKI